MYVSAYLGQAEDTAFSYANLARELVGSKELDVLASKVRELTGQVGKVTELEASLRNAYDGYSTSAAKAKAIPGAVEALGRVRSELDKISRRLGGALYILDMTTLGLMNLGNKLSEAGMKNEADMVTMLRNQEYRLVRQAEGDLNPRSGNAFNNGWTTTRNAFFARANKLGVDTRNQEDVRWWQALSGTEEDVRGLGAIVLTGAAIVKIVVAITTMISVLAIAYAVMHVSDNYVKNNAKIIDLLDQAEKDLKKIDADPSLSPPDREAQRKVVERRVTERIGIIADPKSAPQRPGFSLPWYVWTGGAVFGLVAVFAPLIARRRSNHEKRSREG